MKLLQSNEKRIKACAELFGSFFKIGLFTFGGGIAMLPLIQTEAVEKKHWITDDDIFEITAIAESTPGPIAINMATYVGYQTSGFWGSFFATLGVVLPSFIVILIVSFLLQNFADYQVVKYAFNGIRAGVLALIVRALIMMGKKCPKNIFSYVIAVAAFAAVAFFSANVIIVIACSAALGLAGALIARKRGKL